jgi:hypothetical protein
MFRAPTDTWVRSARTTACIVTLMALTGLALATATGAPAAPPWRAFAASSPWNTTAVPTASNNRFARQFAGSAGFKMKLSGTPDNPKYSSPIFFAASGDPTARVRVGQPSWAPLGITKYDHKPIPVPAGVAPASGSDGHLTVVSADRRTAWEFWRCTAAGPGGYTAEVIVQWDLTGPGYASKRGDNSARGSGTPLIATTLRADEALNGINHALGITVPSVSSGYIHPPASHSDGNDGPGAIKYGMRFVLRGDYRPPAGSGVGERNVIQALKTYGAYVVDQGADFEMDADFTHREIWAQAGLNQNSFDFTGADFRPATPGPAPAAGAPVSGKKRGKRGRVVIHADKHRLRLGGKLHLSGRVRGAVPKRAHVRIHVRSRHGQWRRLRRKPPHADGSFATSARFRDLALSRRTRVILIRAVIDRAGKSNVVRVRLVPRR